MAAEESKAFLLLLVEGAALEPFELEKPELGFEEEVEGVLLLGELKLRPGELLEVEKPASAS